jgi:hypothetical protein
MTKTEARATRRAILQIGFVIFRSMVDPPRMLLKIWTKAQTLGQDQIGGRDGASMSCPIANGG